MLLLNVGAVCSEEETENDLLESHWGDVIANAFVIAWWGVRQSDLLATVPFSFEVNYKIVKKKLKIEEKMPMWTRGLSLNLDEIEIGWGLYLVAGCGILNWITSELIHRFVRRIEGDILHTKVDLQFVWNALNTKKI